ncbi:hypothetical protein EON63_13190 [archaeon]|nr:MAG: hypothetical protein EON63_13190 [archaeon]
MYASILAVAMLFLLLVYEQERTYTRMAGTSCSNEDRSVCVDSNSGIVYVARYAGDALYRQVFAGSSFDVLLLKYASNGTRLWARMVGTAGDDSGFGRPCKPSGASSWTALCSATSSCTSSSKSSLSQNSGSSMTFHAAEYLMVSFRLARAFPHLKTARIIKHYSTVVDVLCRSYDRKFAVLTRSDLMVLVFFAGSLLTMPLSIQDMVLQMATMAVTGYTFLLHVQLFAIYPVLVVLPSLCLLVLAHFWKQKQRKQQQQAINEATTAGRQEDVGGL